MKWLNAVPHSPSRRGSARSWRPIVALATIGALAFGIVGWDFFTPGGSGEQTSIAADDDGAGGTLSPSAQAERYLPIPSALQDERVLAALAPIADLSCKRGEYRAPPRDEAREARLPDLGPLEVDSGVYLWIDRYATAVAMAPIVDPSHADHAVDAGHPNSLHAPLSSPAAEIDALLTRNNLLGAALAPIAALPAPARASEPAKLAVASSPPGECPAILRHTFNRLQTGERQTLCQFQGKVLVVVNTASYCGYTNQYEGLEAMYRKYKDHGLVVVGFPSNDFGSQEPGNNQQIAEFCRTTYGVQFPMFEKSSVARLDANPFYVELASRAGASPKWNFHKYVVDRRGTRVTSFSSDVTPDAGNLVDLIERLLAEPSGTGRG
jgi:glutathione peroxidase